MRIERSGVRARVAAFRCLVLALAIGCDPGLSYVMPGGEHVTDDGVRYLVNIGDGVLARFHSSVFTINGRVQIEVINQGNVPLSFVPTPPVILNADGQKIAASDCRFWKEREPATGVARQTPDVVEKGERATIWCEFRVELSGSFCNPYPSRVRRISFSQPGFSRSGTPLDIHAAMEAQ